MLLGFINSVYINIFTFKNIWRLKTSDKLNLEGNSKNNLNKICKSIFPKKLMPVNSTWIPMKTSHHYSRHIVTVSWVEK